MVGRTTTVGGLVVGGGGAGIGYGCYVYLKQGTIGYYMVNTANPKVDLLNAKSDDTTDDEAWKALAALYKESSDDKWENLSLDNNGEGFKKLKGKCQETIEKLYNSETDDDYVKAKKWCSRPKKVSQMLTEFKWEILNTNNGTNKIEWEAIVKAYKDEITKISEFSVTDTDTTGDSLDTKISALKNLCKGWVNRFYSGNNDSNLKNSERLCVKKKAVKDILKDKYKKTPLQENSDTTEWGKLKTKYSTEHSSKKPGADFSAAQTDGAVSESDLKTACKASLDKEILFTKENKHFEGALSWCIKESEKLNGK